MSIIECPGNPTLQTLSVEQNAKWQMISAQALPAHHIPMLLFMVSTQSNKGQANLQEVSDPNISL